MVLQEAITLAIGLAIFENGFASSDMQLLHSAKSVIAANASYGHPLIADRFEKVWTNGVYEVGFSGVNAD